MGNYIEVTFHAVSIEQSEILIARLADSGFDGFEEPPNELKAFIAEENNVPGLPEQLAAEYRLLFSIKTIRQENWNRLWESGFHPVIINDFAAIRAEFHPPVAGVKHEIVITPKMSFGTGHHATTKMMIEQMSELDVAGKSVLDFGTGTGILAVLAAKMGAGQVLAIDNDEWSIENATENFQKNNCGAITIVKADSADRQGQFDIILANIVKTVILANMDFLAGQLRKGGVLVVSGLLPADEADILQCAKKRSLIVDKKLQENDWICLRFLY